MMTKNQAPERCTLAMPAQMNSWARWLFFAFGWLNVGLGLIGIIVPGMPTTVFLIAALWAFSKSSERFRLWLWNHPRFGLTIRNWHEHKVIPYRAKIMATSMMVISFALVVALADDMTLPLILFMVMTPAALYVNTRASVVTLRDNDQDLRR
ncbi:MAG: YbaN family protein [Rhodospirillaceae bacterium]|nr:YbaN family protein [Rhodospirillaceae bacterium]